MESHDCVIDILQETRSEITDTKGKCIDFYRIRSVVSLGKHVDNGVLHIHSHTMWGCQRLARQVNTA